MLPFNIGFGEMIVIGAIAVMLFGSRLPEVAGQLGRSYQQFRKGLDDIRSSIQNDVNLKTDLDRLPELSADSDIDDQEDYDAPQQNVFEPPAEDDNNEPAESL